MVEIAFGIVEEVTIGIDRQLATTGKREHVAIRKGRAIDCGDGERVPLSIAVRPTRVGQHIECCGLRFGDGHTIVDCIGRGVVVFSNRRINA